MPDYLIDVGSEAIDRLSSIRINGFSYLDLNNPSNGNGVLDTVEIFTNTAMFDVKVGVFYGAGRYFTCRSFTSLGFVSSGLKHVYSGLSLNVQIGDYICVYASNGFIEYTSGRMLGHRNGVGDCFDGLSHEFVLFSETDGVSLFAFATPLPTTSPNRTSRKNFNGYLAFVQQFFRHKMAGTSPWASPDGYLLPHIGLFCGNSALCLNENKKAYTLYPYISIRPFYRLVSNLKKLFFQKFSFRFCNFEKI